MSVVQASRLIPMTETTSVGVFIVHNDARNSNPIIPLHLQDGRPDQSEQYLGKFAIFGWNRAEQEAVPSK